MKKIRVIKRYNDIVLNKIQNVGTVLEVEDIRAKHLVNEKMAEYVHDDVKKAAEKKG